MQHPSHSEATALRGGLALGRWPSSLAAVALVASTTVVARVGRGGATPAAPRADGVVRAEGWVEDNRCAPFLDVGARCVLAIDPSPARGGLTCRMVIRCEHSVLYGDLGAGYLRCRRDEQGALVAEDAMTAERDGDPAVTWRQATGRAELDFGRAGAPSRCVVVAR